MRAILSDIRALPGVTGVAVVNKRDGRMEHIFPAAFGEQHTQRLREMVTNAYQNLRGFTRLALRFERVVIHLFNQSDYLLFVTALPDADIRHLESVVNAKFAAITRVIGGTDSAANSPNLPALGRRTANENVIGQAVGNDAAGILIAICNSLTDRLADSHGRLFLANIWRRSRETAMRSAPALLVLTIEPSGHLSVRKGQVLPSTSNVVSGFAAMIQLFLEGLGTARTVAEEEFYMLAEPHRDVLEPAGVFLYFTAKARSGAAH